MSDNGRTESGGFEEFEGKHAVVLGGAGFLGSHICTWLVYSGARVTCLDNMITGNAANVAHLMGDRRFRLIDYDVTDYIHVAGDVDYVMNFASPASPVDYLRWPIHTLKVGAFGTHKGLGLALEKGATFFHASTSEVYGDPLVNPQPETYWGNVNPIGPRGVYDEAKRFAEAMTMAYRRYHNLDARVVRIFNTYGPRMRPNDGRVVSNFIVQALRNDPLTVYGDGSQTRSFCYASDEVDGIYKLFMNGDHNPTNIGNPDEYTVKQLAELVVEPGGTKSGMVREPLPKDDPKVRKPDITRARGMLGWEPKVHVRD